MNIEKKIIKLDEVINNSEVVIMLKSLLPEEDSEEKILDLKKEIIKLIED